LVRKRDLALPIVGALLASIAINIRKLGLEQINEPILGSMMGFTSALVVYLMVLAASPQVRSGQHAGPQGARN
jgi:zinc transporter ZupT